MKSLNPLKPNLWFLFIEVSEIEYFLYINNENVKDRKIQKQFYLVENHFWQLPE